MTQEELDGLLLDWQKRLRLQDWKITAKIVPQDEIPGKEGKVNIWHLDKTAVIRLSELVETAQSTLTRYFPTTFEKVLLHELIEIHLSLFKPQEESEDKWVMGELAINLIADALIEAKRGH